ncbi:MAG: ECF-type sigma factor [Planctomycetota bacterium]|nr:ECF-type sigma factor [Planctomycetota bacterium]
MQTPNVTALIDECRTGAESARAALLRIVYDELRAMAQAQLSRERPGHTLQATALVNEAYGRVLGTGRFSAENRRHLFGTFAEAMRQILVESARRRNAKKRGGDRERVCIEQAEMAAFTETESEEASHQILAMNAAMDRLRQEDERAAEVVMLLVFGQRTEKEIAEILNVSPKTVQRDWSFARAFLKKFVDEGPCE